MTLRYRAPQGGIGMTLSWAGYAWLVLRACSCNSNQLLQLLQPYQGRFPNTEAEFNALTMALRRMGHILAGTAGNVSNQLRSAPQRGFFADSHTFVATQGDPWQNEGQDPWSNGRGPWAQSASTAQVSLFWHGSAGPIATAPAPAATTISSFLAGAAHDIDSETMPHHRRPRLHRSDLTEMTPNEVDEHLFFQYQKSKANWRKRMHRPTRKVRQSVKG